MRTIAGCAAAAALALAGCGDDGGSGAGAGTGTGPGTDTAERPPPGVACTLIACAPGVNVELADKPDAARRARMCVEGRCRTTRLTGPPSFVSAPLPESSRSDGAEVAVRLTLLDRGGRPLDRHRIRATVVRSQPNGPQCPPVCFNAQLRVAGGELVQPPPRR